MQSILDHLYSLYHIKFIGLFYIYCKRRLGTQRMFLLLYLFRCLTVLLQNMLFSPQYAFVLVVYVTEENENSPYKGKLPHTLVK